MGREQRRFPRAELSLPVTFRRKTALASEWLPGTVKDFGAGGFRFEASELMEAGALIELRLALPIRSDPYVFDCRMLWERPLTASASEYGGVFVELSDAQRGELGAVAEFVSQPGP